jgi:hypothetical protein
MCQMVTMLESFLVLLVASALVLVLLFWLAVRRKYFFHIVPFVVAVAIVASLSLRLLGLQDFFWWYLTLSSAFILALLAKHLTAKDSLEAFGKLRDSALELIPEDEVKEKVARELSPNRQAIQHVIGLVVVFAATLVLVFHVVSYF